MNSTVTNMVDEGTRCEKKGDFRSAARHYQEALAAYQHLAALDEENMVAHVNIGDLQTLLGVGEEATVSYRKALELVQDEQDPHRLWPLADPARAPFRPTDIQFELLRQFIIKAPYDRRISIALTGINALYEHLFDPQNLSAEKLQLNV